MINQSNYDFSSVHHAMQRYVDKEILAGVSTAVLVGRDLVDVHCAGWADKENGIALREDHLFRIFSNSKLVTSIAVLQLMEANKLQLDDPIEQYLPQLAKRRVLKPGAISLEDTEPARSSITIRQLLTHTSGLSYGLLDHGSMIYKAYVERKVLNAAAPLSTLIDVLEELPLTFHPGTQWEYSIATDVLSRLVEVVSGVPFDMYLKAHIFDPLGMQDTSFWVNSEKQNRLTAYYSGSDPSNILQRGLKRLENSPYPGAFVTPVPRLSGGGGLVSSLHDMIALLRGLLPGGVQLLQPETIALMMRNHLPDGTGIAFPGVGNIPGKGFGLGGAVTLVPSSIDPAASTGEFEWGGIAGTHWWISPKNNLAGVLMAQKQMSFWHPFSFEFKRLAYQAVGAN
ncbi:serine hydrolase domain-containing protein [Undibacterium sp. RTI2.1]|uniref:serine hydrolase domain-containing protein n=1 Tax=unclassified Undibacterium TaxID=2630295 RepID=UPI002AB5AF70|nr:MULTISPECIES: serine hydrolase domain-containing protein [unclassified Undibacterium]MDY7539900.1 serine hydrolase domain-containing protein [Undibacterium sp. 5I1]MEB0031189.1 serine hydrolase domain-containing protein [Undibacterium sp. RTI2.1]MEB0116411.1 serine hydrolase domain-containing protein [Undibacterium sp. RTI2.2]MEB0230507.1 serine hydrolase domain-containing protein [Undibacterium sp. 10I3]MEB0257205.1 serine hydrolase domain-containing protein [Undibacterium sp. 5I1]